MTDTEKCAICGGDGTMHYTVTSPITLDVRSVCVCDVCSSKFFVTTDEAREVLRKWDSERVVVGE